MGRGAAYELSLIGVAKARTVPPACGTPSVFTERKARPGDLRAIQWLVENLTESEEMDTFVLAIPGSFNHFVETDVNERHSVNKEAQRGCINKSIKTKASHVCCADIQLGQFGDVGEILSELGGTEDINGKLSTIISNPSFALRWTCIFLVPLQQMVVVVGNRVRELARLGENGRARFESVHDTLDVAALPGAWRIGDDLMTAWEYVENLHGAFESWDQNRTGKEIRNILSGCEDQTSVLECITNQANGLNDVNWRISFLQDVVDKNAYMLPRRFPGVSFDEVKSFEPILIVEAFNFPLSGGTPSTPQFIFHEQQLQGLFALGRGLREIVEVWNSEKHSETVKSLQFITNTPIPLRRLRGLMTRQPRRLQDLRDGGGLGFTIELFFLALRQLSSTSSSPELKWVFYAGTFKVISSSWENSMYSSGTQRILLSLICDLVIKRRGVFSDFSYPAYIVDMLLELVGHMLDGHGDAQPYINSAIEELRDVDSKDCMDGGLRDRVLGMLWGIQPPNM